MVREHQCLSLWCDSVADNRERSLIAATQGSWVNRLTFTLVWPTLSFFSVCVSACLSVSLSLCLSLSVSVCLSLFLSFCHSLSLPPSFCHSLSLPLSLCLSFCQCLTLSCPCSLFTGKETNARGLLLSHCISLPWLITLIHLLKCYHTFLAGAVVLLFADCVSGFYP